MKLRFPAGNRPVAIIGGGVADRAEEEAAHAVAHGLAEAGLAIICGGRGGVMAAACEGAAAAGGLSLAMLPTLDPGAANPHATVVLTTDLGTRDTARAEGRGDHSRNRVIASSAACVVAIGGRTGTANEIKLALQFGTAVFALCGAPGPEAPNDLAPDVVRDLFKRLPTAEAAIEAVLSRVENGPRGK
ncbi:MAG: hypothetical protein OXR84_05700 [Magnetovibrio sp.]|nr:hypothetical protein [Magnetovibrio sp.]